MNLGALETPIIQTMVEDIAKTTKEHNDVTVVTTLATAGKIIAYLEKFEGEFINYCENAKDFTPVILTKLNFKGKEYLYLEDLLFEDGVCKILEYDSTTVYVDYNIKFAATQKIYDEVVSNGGLSISFL